MPVNLNGMDPRVLSALRKIQADAAARGIQTNLISGVRSFEDQKELYANWLAGRSNQPLPYPDRGPVPLAAPPGSSEHEKGFAFDLQATDPSRQNELLSLGPTYGLRTLGSSDRNHFELASGPGRSPSGPAFAASGTSIFSGVNGSARGMRNNNPGNLVSNSWTATLPGYKGSDGRFAIFDTPEHGAAALDTNLSSYGAKGIKTPFAIASTWAPAEDHNNPSSYGAQIAKALGVGLNDNIDLSDPKTRQKIAGAIALVENGPGNGSTPVGGGSGSRLGGAIAAASGGLPEPPPADMDLGSMMSSAVTSAPSNRVSQPDMETPPLPEFDQSYALAEPSVQELGARYEQGKATRKLSPLSQLFSLPTIGSPTPQQPLAKPFDLGVG